MTMKEEQKIRILTKSFFEGKTSIDEEKELYRLYQSVNIPEDLQPYRLMFADLQAIYFPETNQQESIKSSTRIIPIKLLVAAAFIGILITGAILLFYQQQNECVAYIYGKKSTDQEVIMAEMARTVESIAECNENNDVEQQLQEMFN